MSPAITESYKSPPPQDQPLFSLPMSKGLAESPFSNALRSLLNLPPSYLFLAAESESSFIIGQAIHVNGGQAMVS